jgi:prevent-host-death family protein
MATMTVTQARAAFHEAVDRARTEPVVLKHRGRPAVVLVSEARYQELVEAWEDQQDVDAFDRAMAEGGEAIPWDQVMADLGWR